MSRTTTTTLEDQRIPVRAKLAAAWTSFMFLYIYVDYFHLYKPGFVDDILAGIVHEFDIGPDLCRHCAHAHGHPDPHGRALHDAARPCQPHHNLVVATLYIPVSIYNAAGESWTYSYFYGLSIGLEVLLLAFILRSAWTWPRTAPPATMATSPDREAVRAQQHV